MGGARGLAHIGVIQWLSENGYDIRSIAGSSMGALVGGIYAAGKLPVYTKWVLALERMQVVRLLNDTTELTVAVSLSGPVEMRPPPPPSAPLPEGNSYRQRVHAFIGSLRHATLPAPPARGMFDIAFASMEAMHGTITQLRLAAFSPDVMIEVPRNACGLLEFWRAAEMIALGRERTARAFAATTARARLAQESPRA